MVIEILLYENLNPGDLGEKIQKVINSMQAGDFRSPDVKKIDKAKGYYRAKLDYTNRLLLQICRNAGTTYIFVMEVIHNHVYERSKFLNGAVMDEDKFTPIQNLEELKEEELANVNYINPHRKTFRILDKVLSLDDRQEEILHLPSPCIIIGSAGSGKTALILEKLKLLKGNILYTTASPFLVENASQLYSYYGLEDRDQEVSFLSFNDYLFAIDMPEGQEADYGSFAKWISKHKQAYKIKDANRIFEEIKGVITGSVTTSAWLTLDEYKALGIKQSIFPVSDRDWVYELFKKYLSWIAEEGYFDTNILSFQLRGKVRPIYDYIVIDEVQDLTMVQLSLILKSLKYPSGFVLCGDANQIVHPNFFSWAQIKTMFYQQNLQENIVRVLSTNYRNTPEITALANNLLLVKMARFGSIDKESNYLAVPNSNQQGLVEFLENTPKNNAELNDKTHLSTKFCVIVLRDEDKAAARKYFKTPLIFSVHEAKGLEYDNVILFNAISSNDREFKEITNGVVKEDLVLENPEFSRARDKGDKSLEEYKFYINAFFVAITRTKKNLYIIETNKEHPLLRLLGLVDFKQRSSLTNQTSTKDEWREEALRLEKQGKKEQMDSIRDQILQLKPVPWTITTRKDVPELKRQALNPDSYNKKSKDRLYQYLVYHNQYHLSEDLARLKYGPARRMYEEDDIEINSGFATLYYKNDLKTLINQVFSKYGINFRSEVNYTPLMSAILFEQPDIIEYLLDNGARTDLEDNLGNNAMQLQMLLIHKFNFQADKKDVFNRFYNRLKPESLKIRISNQLIKIGNHESEFLILNFMIVSLFARLEVGCRFQDPGYTIEGIDLRPGFQISDFTRLFAGMPESALPEYQQKTAYISSVLSKNEVNSNAAGNRKLFVRLKKGIYVPNPLMEIFIDDQWVNVYDNIDIDFITKRHPEEHKRFIILLLKFREQLTRDPNAVLDQAAYWGEFE